MGRLVFLAVAATLPVQQPAVFSVFDYKVVLTDIVFVVCVCTTVWSLAISRGAIATLRWSSWHTAVSAVVCASVVSAAAAGHPRDWVKAAATGYLGALAILADHYCHDARGSRSVFYAWLGGTLLTLLACALGVGLFLAGSPHNRFLYGFGSLPSGAYPRVQGLFTNANMLCSYLAASALLLAGATSAGWIRQFTGRALIVATFCVSLLTLSPGLGGLFMALAWWPTNRRRAVKWGGALAAVICVLAILPSPTMLQRAEPFGLRNIEPSSRVQAWQGAMATFMAHPVFGAGPGAEVADVHYVNASGGTERLTDAHNTVLSVLAQTGTVGFVAFFAMLALLLQPTLKNRGQTSRTAWCSGCEFALAAALLYPSLSGSFEDARHLWVLMGLVHGAQSHLTGEQTVSFAG